MAGLIKFFYSRKRFFFKLKNTLFYYFRFWSIGIVVGLVSAGLWKAFASDGLKKGFIELDGYLPELFGNLLKLHTNLAVLILIIFTTIVLLSGLIENFRVFLRGSLIYTGFLSWLSLGENKFWKDPFFWKNRTIPESFLTILYFLTFWIIVTDFTFLILNALTNQVKISIIPHIVSWIDNLKGSIKVKVDKEKLNLPQIIKDPKQWWSELAGRGNKLSEPSDEPLKKFLEIKLIRGSVGQDEIFQIFEKNLIDLKDLIDRDDSSRSYTKSICLDGPWGSGKTSLINIVREDILRTGKEKVIWLDFYPWNFTNRTELIKDFFNTLNKELVGKYKIDLQPNLEPYVDLITPLIESAGLFGSLKSILTKVPFLANKNLIGLKENICKKLERIPDKIVIVLDDLDRLELREIETVLQLVRQLSNFPNILFILPFDYKRISDLIVEKKGPGYADFLDKIINGRVILEAYNYKELESIFISSVKHNPTPQEMEKLKDVFSSYVKERNRSRFEDVRKKESTAIGSDPTLSPTFIFANELFRILYPSDHLKDHYGVLENRVKDLLNFYLGDSTTSGDSLESEIFEKLSLIKKINLANKFNDFKAQIDSDMSSAAAGANPDEINSLNTSWNTFINSLNGGGEHKTIESNLNGILSFQITSTTPPVQIITLPNIKIALDQMGLDLAKYKTEFDDNHDYHTKIKNWFVQSITPRHVKYLARKEMPYVARIIEAIDEEKAVAVNVARLQ